MFETTCMHACMHTRTHTHTYTPSLDMLLYGILGVRVIAILAGDRTLVESSGDWTLEALGHLPHYHLTVIQLSVTNMVFHFVVWGCQYLVFKLLQYGMAPWTVRVFLGILQSLQTRRKFSGQVQRFLLSIIH